MSEKSKKNLSEVFLEGLKEINVPKQLLEKSAELLKTLFGESMKEIGGIFADNIKLRRFKNQVKILEKAQEILKEKKLDPQKVPLKVLAPLVNKCSLEEEETLQMKWANLIANIVSNDNNILLELNCIEILNKISVIEAKLLDFLYDEFFEQRAMRIEKIKNRNLDLGDAHIPVSKILFNLDKIRTTFNLSKENFEDYISNLISFGVIDYDVPSVSVDAQKSDEDPNDLDIDIDISIKKPNEIHLTNLGVKFVEICNT